MIVFTILMCVLAVVLATVFTFAIRAYKKDYGENIDRDALRRLKRFRAIGTIVPLFLVFAGLLIGGVRIVDSTEIGVVKTFGEISDTIDSGLNIINPLVSKVQMYDLRVHVRESSFASYTRDAQPVEATVEYQFELDPAYVKEIAREYGSQEILESKIGNLVEEKVKVVIARYSGMSLLENRASLSAEIDNAVEPLEEMFHIRFRSTIVKDLDFSDAFEKSVEAKMEAEQNALKAEQEKKKAVIKAEEAREVAAIEAEAAVAKAKGEAEALMITKEALERMPESWVQQMYLEKWNGVLPQIISEGSNLMLTPNLGK